MLCCVMMRWVPNELYETCFIHSANGFQWFEWKWINAKRGKELIKWKSFVPKIIAVKMLIPGLHWTYRLLLNTITQRWWQRYCCIEFSTNFARMDPFVWTLSTLAFWYYYCGSQAFVLGVQCEKRYKSVNRYRSFCVARDHASNVQMPWWVYHRVLLISNHSGRNSSNTWM